MGRERERERESASLIDTCMYTYCILQVVLHYLHVYMYMYMYVACILIPSEVPACKAEFSWCRSKTCPTWTALSSDCVCTITCKQKQHYETSNYNTKNLKIVSVCTFTCIHV